MARSHLGLTCLLFLGGCYAQGSQAQGAHERPAPVLNVALATAGKQRVPETLKLTGTLTANRESDVAADTLGKIATVGIERGSEVREGMVLAKVDARHAALQLDASRTRVASARARAELAQLEHARAETLFARGAINQAEYDRHETQHEDAALAVEAAQLAQRLAQKDLVDLAVRAPFAGVVAERYVNAGEHVTPDTRVARIVQLDPLRLELSVPESEVGRFGEGAEVRFKVAAFPNETFAGKVHYVGAAVRPTTRDLLVEAVVPNPKRRLRPGMFATAEVVLGEATMPSVPVKALRTDERSGTDRVLVVGDTYVIEERLVQVGPTADDLVAIRAGLREGERVVVSPSAELRDGARVQSGGGS